MFTPWFGNNLGVIICINTYMEIIIIHFRKSNLYHNESQNSFHGSSDRIVRHDCLGWRVSHGGRSVRNIIFREIRQRINRRRPMTGIR
jgi:hypothetical protein